MFILCDTSSILLLLRIAPDMFVDARYECCTIREIHDEIIRTTKFKSKYPWTRSMRPKLKPLTFSEEQKKSEEIFYSAISFLIRNGIVNKKTKRFFDLSREDMKVISNALALGYRISSGDNGLIEFAKQEFADEFAGSVSALEVINIWIEKNIITWNQEKQNFLSDWKTQREVAQPPKAVSDFKRLTKMPYTGS
jgi:hypothetical protein